MKKQRYIDNKQKLDTVLAQYKKKCSCGHTQIVFPKNEFVICKWCGHKLYYNDNVQKIYNEKIAKDNFMKKLNECINEIQKKETKKKELMEKKKKMHRKYFKDNKSYFAFCHRPDITIYIVDRTNGGNIKVFYGAKLGRPKKNIEKSKPEEFKYRKSAKYYNKEKDIFKYFN